MVKMWLSLPLRCLGGRDRKTTLQQQEQQLQKSVHVNNLKACLEKCLVTPPRAFDGPLRVPISTVEVDESGDVTISGRVEQGFLFSNKEDSLRFLLLEEKNEEAGELAVVTATTRAYRIGLAAGDIVEITAENLLHLPQVGDCITSSLDRSLKATKSFVALVQVIEQPCRELRKGIVRTCKAVCKTERQTGKLMNPDSLKAGDVAEVVFEPLT